MRVIKVSQNFQAKSLQSSRNNKPSFGATISSREMSRFKKYLSLRFGFSDKKIEKVMQEFDKFTPQINALKACDNSEPKIRLRYHRITKHAIVVSGNGNISGLSWFNPCIKLTERIKVKGFPILKTEKNIAKELFLAIETSVANLNKNIRRNAISKKFNLYLRTLKQPNAEDLKIKN